MALGSFEKTKSRIDQRHQHYQFSVPMFFVYRRYFIGLIGERKRHFKSGKVKRRSPISKNEIVRERLRILHHMKVAIKSNRRVALKAPQDNLNREYHRVDELDFQKASTITVWLKGMDFPVTLHRQVFTNKDGSKGELYLVTNLLSKMLIWKNRQPKRRLLKAILFLPL